jgi:hypothetical protein
MAIVRLEGLGKSIPASNGRAVAQRLDAGFPPRRPGLAYGHHVGFVVDKAALGQVFSEYFGFPCQPFHRFLHYLNHPGLTQLAIKWPQCRVNLESTPHYAKSLPPRHQCRVDLNYAKSLPPRPVTGF